MAILLVDNCPSHTPDDAKLILAINNTIFLTMPFNARQYLQMCHLRIFGAYKHHLQTLRRKNTLDTPEQVGVLAVSALHQTTVLINLFNRFRKSGLQQKWNAQRRSYIEICPDSFIAVLEAIEADKLLLKYTGTKQTRKRAKKPSGYINEEEIFQFDCLGRFN
ncbi:MAG: hypothetical protein EZS28_013078 [Streblomastix strix]|uniref:DDE-1 domain-containing protein n=1 Tax=Streblomastix strix TaxID=222440 RepID=A0A5J4W9Q9_9EUKA|nr:MAG: hypothetical protein EZS28_013078 [Streblomastix strix]